MACVALPDLGEQVVDLGTHRADFDHGIDEPGGPHHLLDDLSGNALLVRSGGRRDVDGLRRELLELLEAQRPVVERRGESEAVFDQGFLARAVAPVHGAELRNGLVALIDHQQRVLRQIIEQARRRLARLAPRQEARVILDAGAIADLVHHLQVEQRALLQALGLEELAGGVELGQARAQLVADLIHRLVHPLLRRHVVRRGIDREARHLAQHLAGQGIEQAQAVDALVEELDPHRLALRFGREDIDDIAAHPIGALLQIDLVAGVLHVRESAQELALLENVAARHVQHHAQVGLRVAQAVDRGHRRHDDRVGPLEQRLGRGQAHLLDVLVDRGVLLDERVGGRYVGLGLVVVVVGDEVLDRVLGKEHLEFPVELRRQSLVVREHQRRALQLLDHVRNGEGLPRAGHAQKRLMSESAGQPVDQLLYRLGLIACGTVVRIQFKAHRAILSRYAVTEALARWREAVVFRTLLRPF